MSGQQPSNDREFGQWVNKVRNAIQNRSCTRVSINRFCNEKLRVFGLALQNNSKVTELEIYDDENNGIYDADAAEILLEFVRTSSTLNSVACREIRSENLVCEFLQAAAENSSVEKVSLEKIPSLDAMIRLLLQQSKTIKRLDLEGIGVRWTSASEVDLADAFQENKSLECLYLRFWNFRQIPFRIFSDQIIKSNSLKSMEIFNCFFDTASSKLLLELACQNQPTIEELKLGHQVEFENEDSTSFCLKIIQSKSLTGKLKSLHVYHGVDVEQLLRPFQEYCTSSEPLLECLHFSYIDYDDFDQFVANLPSLRRMIELWLYQLPTNVKMIKLVEAMQKNHTLKSLQVDWDGGGEMINNTFEMLSKRNQNIQRWHNGPYLIPDKYMYRVLASCLHYECRADIMFDILKKHWSQLDHPINSRKRSAVRDEVRGTKLAKINGDAM